MEIQDVKNVVKDAPHMSNEQAAQITSIIIENGFRNILELGFRHGVSTCYMAAALEKIGGGKITTIDLQNAKNATPNIEDLLNKLGLAENINILYEPRSYVWRLMKLIEENSSPYFDLCYIDGAHDWYADGFSFFLVDKLLKNGGMIIFDDLNWTYSSSEALKDSEFVKGLPEEEKTTPQIKKVYELLVKQHPAYGEFNVVNDWATARKIHSSDQKIKIKKEIIYEKVEVGIGSIILKAAKSIKNRF